MKTQATSELIAALRGTTCICGAPKGRGQSFCRICYHALTRAQKAALYRRITAGYADAYADARHHLEQLGRLAQEAPPTTSGPPPGEAAALATRAPPPPPGLGTTGRRGFG